MNHSTKTMSDSASLATLNAEPRIAKPSLEKTQQWIEKPSLEKTQQCTEKPSLEKPHRRIDAKTRTRQTAKIRDIKYRRHSFQSSMNRQQLDHLNENFKRNTRLRTLLSKKLESHGVRFTSPYHIYHNVKITRN
mmetsp:Transcript_34747/g.84071  ORF Transcript_34747/g.84071 Transcript_34747/m.84071 type:complete len:134 (-) Transcript_34747:609-1010(-)